MWTSSSKSKFKMDSSFHTPMISLTHYKTIFWTKSTPKRAKITKMMTNFCKLPMRVLIVKVKLQMERLSSVIRDLAHIIEVHRLFPTQSSIDNQWVHNWWVMASKRNGWRSISHLNLCICGIIILSKISIVFWSRRSGWCLWYMDQSIRWISKVKQKTVLSSWLVGDREDMLEQGIWREESMCMGMWQTMWK